MEQKNPVEKFLTKAEFISAMDKGRFSFIEEKAFQNINICQSNDVIGIKVLTGSKLKVLDAFKLDEAKFMELTSFNK